MIEVISAIALLCQVNIGAGTGKQNEYIDDSARTVLKIVTRKQEKCHKWYMNCYANAKGDGYQSMKECILKK